MPMLLQRQVDGLLDRPRRRGPRRAGVSRAGRAARGSWTGVRGWPAWTWCGPTPRPAPSSSAACSCGLGHRHDGRADRARSGARPPPTACPGFSRAFVDEAGLPAPAVELRRLLHRQRAGDGPAGDGAGNRARPRSSRPTTSSPSASRTPSTSWGCGFRRTSPWWASMTCRRRWSRSRSSRWPRSRPTRWGNGPSRCCSSAWPNPTAPAQEVVLPTELVDPPLQWRSRGSGRVRLTRPIRSPKRRRPRPVGVTERGPGGGAGGYLRP